MCCSLARKQLGTHSNVKDASDVRNGLSGVWPLSVLKLFSRISDKYQNESRRAIRGRAVTVSLLAVVETELANLRSKPPRVLLRSAQPQRWPRRVPPPTELLYNTPCEGFPSRRSPADGLAPTGPPHTRLPRACRHKVRTDLLRSKTL